MLTLQEIKEKKFEKAAMFGYKVDDVDAFLDDITASYQQLLSDKSELESKIEVLAEKLEEYKNDEDNLRAALIGAQRLGETVIRDAKHKADVLIEDATIRSEKLVESAQKKIENEQNALLKMQKEVTSFKNKLLGLYKTHLELISSLPGEEEKPAEPESSAKTDVSAPAPAAKEAATQPKDREEEEGEPVIQGFQINPEAFEEKQAEASPVESRFGPLKFGANYEKASSSSSFSDYSKKRK